MALRTAKLSLTASQPSAPYRPGYVASVSCAKYILRMRNKPRMFYLLSRAQRAVQATVERACLTELGATPVQLGLLYCLEGEASVPMAEVGRALDLSPAALTGLVDRMEAGGLIERLPSPSDGRAVNLSATARGAELRQTSYPTLSRLNDELLDGLSEAERTTVVTFLESLCTRFGSEGRAQEGALHDRARHRRR